MAVFEKTTVTCYAIYVYSVSPTIHINYFDYCTCMCTSISHEYAILLVVLCEHTHGVQLIRLLVMRYIYLTR